MRIQEYISFRYKGEAATGLRQYETVHAREYYDQNTEALSLELWKYYYSGAFAEERPSRKYAFLDYHYHAFAEEKIDFVNFVKKSPSRIPDEVLDIYIRMYLEGEFEEVVNSWLERLDLAGQKQSLGGGPARERIKPNLMSLEEIEKHFLDRLTAESRVTGEQIMTEEQVRHLINSNIEDEKPAADVVKIKTRGDAKEVQATIYDFYALNETPYTKSDSYCDMALDNFKEFNSITSKASFKKNFAKYTQVKRG